MQRRNKKGQWMKATKKFHNEQPRDKYGKFMSPDDLEDCCEECCEEASEQDIKEVNVKEELQKLTEEIDNELNTVEAPIEADITDTEEQIKVLKHEIFNLNKLINTAQKLLKLIELKKKLKKTKPKEKGKPKKIELETLISFAAPLADIFGIPDEELVKILSKYEKFIKFK